MKHIYLDMDGVLANFDGQANALERFSVEPDFFVNLAPTCLVGVVNHLLQNSVARENIHILSASPNETADKAKMIWLNTYLPNLKPENIHIIRGGKGADERKAVFANEMSILIDDYSGNLIKWESKGGKGVKLLNGNNGKGVKWKGDTLTLDVPLRK